MSWSPAVEEVKRRFDAAEAREEAAARQIRLRERMKELQKTHDPSSLDIHLVMQHTNKQMDRLARLMLSEEQVHSERTKQSMLQGA